MKVNKDIVLETFNQKFSFRQKIRNLFLSRLIEKIAEKLGLSDTLTFMSLFLLQRTLYENYKLRFSSITLTPLACLSIVIKVCATHVTLEVLLLAFKQYFNIEEDMSLCPQKLAKAELLVLHSSAFDIFFRQYHIKLFSYLIKDAYKAPEVHCDCIEDFLGYLQIFPCSHLLYVIQYMTSFLKILSNCKHVQGDILEDKNFNEKDCSATQFHFNLQKFICNCEKIEKAGRKNVDKWFLKFATTFVSFCIKLNFNEEGRQDIRAMRCIGKELPFTFSGVSSLKVPSKQPLFFGKKHLPDLETLSPPDEETISPLTQISLL